MSVSRVAPNSQGDIQALIKNLPCGRPSDTLIIDSTAQVVMQAAIKQLVDNHCYEGKFIFFKKIVTQSSKNPNKEEFFIPIIINNVPNLSIDELNKKYEHTEGLILQLIKNDYRVNKIIVIEAIYRLIIAFTYALVSYPFAIPEKIERMRADKFTELAISIDDFLKPSKNLLFFIKVVRELIRDLPESLQSCVCIKRACKNSEEKSGPKNGENFSFLVPKELEKDRLLQQFPNEAIAKWDLRRIMAPWISLYYVKENIIGINQKIFADYMVKRYVKWLRVSEKGRIAMEEIWEKAIWPYISDDDPIKLGTDFDEYYSNHPESTGKLFAVFMNWEVRQHVEKKDFWQGAEKVEQLLIEQMFRTFAEYTLSIRGKTTPVFSVSQGVPKITHEYFAK